MARYSFQNVWPVTLPDYYATPSMLVLLRHMFWWADWTEVSIVADAFWTTSMPINEAGGVGTGFEVEAASPGIVYDPLGRFTASMATYRYILFLKGTGQNRVVAHIISYIDANHVRVASECLDSLGWANEDEIPARVIGGNSGGSSRFDNGYVALNCAFVVQAPVGNLRLRFIYNAAGDLIGYAQPKGGAGTATETTGTPSLINYGSNNLRINGVFEDQDVLVTLSSDAQLAYILAGELDDVDAADTDPGLITGASDLGTSTPWTKAVYMLDNVDAPISGWALYPKRYNGTTWANSPMVLPQFRTDAGQAALRRFLVHLDNVASVGACFRGYLPLIRGAHITFEPFRPLDAARDWVHFGTGLVIPWGGSTVPNIIRGS